MKRIINAIINLIKAYNKPGNDVPRMQSVSYRGKTYITRKIVYENDCILLLAETDLQKAIEKENGKPRDKEAARIWNEIFAYIPKQLLLSGSQDIAKHIRDNRL